MAETTEQTATSNEESTQEVSQEGNESQETAEASSGDQEQANDLQAKADSGQKLTKAEKKTLKQLKLKIDGQEFVEDLPFEIDDDPSKVDWLKKNLQLSKVAQKRMQEQALLQKEVTSFIEELRKNPRKVLSDPNLGVDLKAIAKELIEEEIINSQKSPEQIEREKLESELRSLKEEREREAEEYKQREFERLQQQELERYDMKITKALGESKLPKSPYVVKKMADYMLLAVENGIDAEPEDVLPLVEQEIQEDIKQMFAVMPEDVIENLIGKDVLNKVRKRNLAKAPPAPVKAQIKDVGAKTQKAEEPKQKISYKEFFKF